MQVEFTNNSDAFKKAMAEHVAAVLETIGQHIEGEAMEELNNDPRHIDTGNLRNSISHAVENTEDAVYIGTNVEYAPYVHEGTGIYATSGGRTTPWVYQDDKGNWHVTRGMKPNRFLRNAVERNEAQVKAYIEQELKN